LKSFNNKKFTEKLHLKRMLRKQLPRTFKHGVTPKFLVTSPQRRTFTSSRSASGQIESAAGVEFKAEHEIIIVGSGAAGSASALSAAVSGATDILMLEKDKKVIGGTTAKSGGIFWIPNNPLMQADGLEDKKEDWLPYAARKSFGHKFDKSNSNYGLSQREYDWLNQYYDVGPEMVQGLVDHGVTRELTNMKEQKDGTVMVDYAYSPDAEPDNKQPVGRMLGIGSDTKIKNLIHKLEGFLSRYDASISKWSQKIPGLRDLRLLRTFGCDISQGVGVEMIKSFQGVLKEKG